MRNEMEGDYLRDEIRGLKNIIESQRDLLEYIFDVELEESAIDVQARFEAWQAKQDE